MKTLNAKIKLTCANNGVKATFNLKADLVVDEKKSFEDFENSIMNDLSQQFNNIVEYTITYKVKK